MTTRTGLFLAWLTAAGVLTSAPVANVQPAAGSSTVSARAIDAGALMSTVRALTTPPMEGREAGAPGGLHAREWVLAQFKHIGLPPAAGGYLQPFRFTSESGDNVEGANIAATCAGLTADSRVMVITAHYDHLGRRAGQVFPGADDNASGVAVLLEMARACRAQPFAHTVVFVAFDAEEQGLHGAKAFVDSPPVPLGRIAVNINFDMVARGDKGELYAAGTQHSPGLKPILDKVAASAPIKLLFGHDRPGSGSDDWTGQSDHAAFHRAGIPFVYFGVEDHPDYHQPTDTVDKIDATFFAGAAATISNAVVALDRSLPLK
jgi:Zn-dependent M28 family amino/carboxypeptidase